MKDYSPSCIALSFDGFGSISWHSVLEDFSSPLLQFSHFVRISNLFDLGIIEDTCTLLVEMPFWSIRIGILLVLHQEKGKLYNQNQVYTDPWLLVDFKKVFTLSQMVL
jgi:hypothetical protein